MLAGSWDDGRDLLLGFLASLSDAVVAQVHFMHRLVVRNAGPRSNLDDSLRYAGELQDKYE